MVMELFAEDDASKGEELMRTPGLEKWMPFPSGIKEAPLEDEKSKGQRVATVTPAKFSKKRKRLSFFRAKKYESSFGSTRN